VLHAFTGADGAGSEAPIAIGAAGNLYGTTSVGGSGAGCVGSLANGCGVVFELASSNGTWTETVLHDFRTHSNNSDGIYPNAVVLHGGDLYGTTYTDGSKGNGTVFKLMRSQAWKERVLHRFAGNPDGSTPVGGVTFDKVGNLYGTTQHGGRNSCTQGCGLVFKLTYSAQNWTEKVLHRFTGSKDGANPISGLTLDDVGNIYGVASDGGSGGKGVAFKLVPQFPGAICDGKGWNVASNQVNSYSVQRRKSSAPLVPPKPNELDMAYSTSAFLGWLGT